MRFPLAIAFFLLPFSGRACPAGYNTWFDGYCFRSGDTYETYEDAQSICARDAAYLVSIHSPSENEYIRWSWSHAGPSLLTLGLRCNGTTGDFIWADGTAVDYTNFGGDYKCNTRYDYILQQGDGKWTATASGIPHNYVCRLPHTSNSPCDEYNRLGNTSTCINLNATIMVDWSTAEQTCVAQNGHLASIHDMKTNNFIRDGFVEAGYMDGVHIGLTTNQSTSSYAWSDRSAVDFTNFATGFPNDIFGHCTAMDTSSDDGRWMTVHCSGSRLHFACIRPVYEPGKPLASSTCLSNAYFTTPGELYSQSYPIGFPANQSCTYVVAAPDGAHVQIDFIDFETNACCDTLTLLDGILGHNVTAKLSGWLAPSDKRSFRSTDNVMRLVWTPTSGVGVRGWHARFSFV